MSPAETAIIQVAVTRHGQTVGIFIPTPGPSQADLITLKRASDRLEAVVVDFKAERKAASARRR